MAVNERKYLHLLAASYASFSHTANAVRLVNAAEKQKKLTPYVKAYADAAKQQLERIGVQH